MKAVRDAKAAQVYTSITVQIIVSEVLYRVIVEHFCHSLALVYKWDHFLSHSPLKDTRVSQATCHVYKCVNIILLSEDIYQGFTVRILSKTDQSVQCLQCYFKRPFLSALWRFLTRFPGYCLVYFYCNIEGLSHELGVTYIMLSWRYLAKKYTIEQIEQVNFSQVSSMMQ